MPPPNYRAGYGPETSLLKSENIAVLPASADNTNRFIIYLQVFPLRSAKLFFEEDIVFSPFLSKTRIN